MLPHNFNGFWSPAFWNSLSASSQSSAQTAENVGYNLWQMPLCYWQTVSTIMGLRSKSTAALTQNWLECCQQLAQCKTPAQAGTCLQSGYQNALGILTQLNLNTHQNRAELWRNWQILAQRSLPQGAQTPQGSQPNAPRFTGSMAQTQPSHGQQPQGPSSPQGPTIMQPKGWFVAGTPTKNAIKTQSVASFEPKNTLPLPNPSPIPTPFPGSLPIKQPEPTPKPIPMAVGQSFQSQNPQSETPTTSSPSTPQFQATPSQTGTIISSTSNSVVRSSSGATVASAAATRRSVLARHTSRKGRLGRPR